MTGNPAVIDLTNMDQPQDQCTTSTPAVGNEATKNQDAAQPEVAPAGSTHQSISTSPAGQPAARTYQSASGPTTGQPVASSLQLISSPPADQPVASTSRPPADLPVASTSYQLEAYDDKQSDRAETWFDRAFDEMLQNDSPVVTPSDTDEEEETMDVSAAGGDQQVQSSAEGTTDDDLLSIEEHQARIPFNASLPSTLAPTITPIRFGQGIEFREVDAYKANLP
ncbi:MYST-like histone acetyltransferase 1 [Dorcoceras hygrometricum]|uniref:MYST-like histone acetyltransferase 1 n=1 Tax=Dorcoceras hygrometricum TaxID=472368 RepID=A0A2Z7BSW3_9LAMI|nr:MYST-like histone acetyltransferase 1 [Dorcoceras hygrometricum]